MSEAWPTVHVGLTYIDQTTVDAMRTAYQIASTAGAGIANAQALTALRGQTVETDLGPAVLTRTIEHVLGGEA